MDEIRIRTLLEFLEMGIIDIDIYEDALSEINEKK
jgi:hypothetical protein